MGYSDGFFDGLNGGKYMGSFLVKIFEKNDVT